MTADITVTVVKHLFICIHHNDRTAQHSSAIKIHKGRKKTH